MTVIGKADELVAEVGKEKAIEFFENKIKELGEDKDFQTLCKKSGYETALMHIKGETEEYLKSKIYK